MGEYVFTSSQPPIRELQSSPCSTFRETLIWRAGTSTIAQQSNQAKPSQIRKEMLTLSCPTPYAKSDRKDFEIGRDNTKKQRHYGMSMVLVAEGPGGVSALTAAKVFSLFFISCENHYTYGSKINFYVLLISTVI